MKSVFFALMMTSVFFGQSIKQKFYVESELLPFGKSSNNKTIKEYTVLSENGNLIYNVSNETNFDIPYAELKVFDSRESALISAFYGTIDFYNGFGSKVKSLKIRENIAVEYERGIRAVVYKNYLLISFQELNEKFTTIQKYSSSGVLEKEFLLDLNNVTGLAYSSDLEYIYVSRIEWQDQGVSSEYISLVDENGQILNTFKSSFERGCFLENNQFVAYSKKELISIEDGNSTLAIREIAKGGFQFIDITIIKNVIIAVSAGPPTLAQGEWHYKNPAIQKIDLSGNVLEEHILETDLFSQFRFNNSEGVVQFIADGKKFEL